MKKNQKISKMAQEVANSIDAKLYDYQEECKAGRASGDMINCFVQIVLNTLDNWTPRLTTSVRLEVLDWIQSEYGLCL